MAKSLLDHLPWIQAFQTLSLMERNVIRNFRYKYFPARQNYIFLPSGLLGF